MWDEESQVPTSGQENVRNVDRKQIQLATEQEGSF
jgi:hypothetical protein